MLIGAHVSAAGGLLPAIDRAAAIGAEVVQVHTQSPRMWRQNGYSDELLGEFADRLVAHRDVVQCVCHASYLINLASVDQGLMSKSRTCLVRNLEVATAMGSTGLVLHLGSHLGAGIDTVVDAVARELIGCLDEASEHMGRPACKLLMENTAGAGGTIGRSFAELARVLHAAGGDERLGLCLDTQHLFASGTTFDTLPAADAVISGIETQLGLDRLGCIHLNDSKVPAGSNRDRHENLGEGFIGARALGCLLGHPALQSVPCVLEVPGSERKGPGATDIATARALVAAGVRRWKRRGPTRQPRPAPRPVPGGRTGSRRGR